MALGTITATQKVGSASVPIFVDLLSFAGDGDYHTNGTPNFQAAVRAKLGHNATVLFVVPEDCGGYVPVYDISEDKLKVYYQDCDAVSDGPLIEMANHGDLSLVTFNVWVWSY